MIPQNVLNVNKRGNIVGRVFHLFYPELSTMFWFDANFEEPIMWGNKNVVMAQIKKLDNLLEVPKTTKVKIFTYIMSQQGYRRIDTFDAPIEEIGRYIRRV